MKRAVILSAIALVFFGFISCSKNSTPNPNITFKATMNGASEAPPNSSTGTGSATLVFNNSTKIFTVTTTYSGLTGAANGAHIHKGAVGTAGGVVFAFVNLASPISYTSAALDASQEADLKAGLYYVNVHTAANSAGEIRGQLIQQ